MLANTFTNVAPVILGLVLWAAFLILLGAGWGREIDAEDAKLHAELTDPDGTQEVLDFESHTEVSR